MPATLRSSIFLLLGLWAVFMPFFTEASTRQGRRKSSSPPLSPGIMNLSNYCPFNSFLQLFHQIPIVRSKALTDIRENRITLHQAVVSGIMGRLQTSKAPIDISEDLLKAYYKYLQDSNQANMFEPGRTDDATVFVDWLLVHAFPRSIYDLFEVQVQVSRFCQGVMYDAYAHDYRSFSVLFGSEYEGGKAPKKIQLAPYLKGELETHRTLKNVQIGPPDTRLAQFHANLMKLGNMGVNLDKNTAIERIQKRIIGPLLSVDVRRDYTSDRKAKLVYEEVMKLDGHTWYLSGVVIYQPGFHFYSIARTLYGKSHKEDKWHILNDSSVTESSLKEALSHGTDVLWLFFAREDELGKWRAAAQARERTYIPDVPAWLDKYLENNKHVLDAVELPSYDEDDTPDLSGSESSSSESGEKTSSSTSSKGKKSSKRGHSKRSNSSDSGSDSSDSEDNKKVQEKHRRRDKEVTSESEESEDSTLKQGSKGSKKPSKKAKKAKKDKERKKDKSESENDEDFQGAVQASLKSISKGKQAKRSSSSLTEDDEDYQRAIEESRRQQEEQDRLKENRDRRKSTPREEKHKKTEGRKPTSGDSKTRQPTKAKPNEETNRTPSKGSERKKSSGREKKDARTSSRRKTSATKWDKEAREETTKKPNIPTVEVIPKGRNNTQKDSTRKETKQHVIDLESPAASHEKTNQRNVSPRAPTTLQQKPSNKPKNDDLAKEFRKHTKKEHRRHCEKKSKRQREEDSGRKHKKRSKKRHSTSTKEHKQGSKDETSASDEEIPFDEYFRRYHGNVY